MVFILVGLGGLLKVSRTNLLEEKKCATDG